MRAEQCPCSRYWGSDGTLCATHSVRFADASSNRCAARVVAIERAALAADGRDRVDAAAQTIVDGTLADLPRRLGDPR